MSPEQAAARWETIGPANDIFSLGAILYGILSGRPPYGGRWHIDALDKVKLCEFPRPRQVKADVPSALEAVCLKAMEHKPEQRYATALDLAADIRSWLAGEPVTAWREPVSLRTRRWMRHHRTPATSSRPTATRGLRPWPSSPARTMTWPAARWISAAYPTLFARTSSHAPFWSDWHVITPQ
jgi:serine/threonine protein kinase